MAETPSPPHPELWSAKLPIAPLKRSPPTIKRKPVPKRSRASAPKVKSGCRTCKIRHVKCDEARPACTQCVRTQRICDGYPLQVSLQSTSTTTKTPPPLPSILLWNPTPNPGTPRERRALAFFQCVTAPQLATYFDAAFWTRLISQLGAADAGVRHAVAALGSLAETRDRGVGLVPHHASLGAGVGPADRATLIVANRDAPFALAQYNLAVRAIATRSREESGAVELAAVVAVAFMFIEFLRGDMRASKEHFRGCVNLARTFEGGRSGAGSNSETLRGLAANMVPFIDRLELLSTTFGSDSSDWTYSVQLEQSVPLRFSTIRDARDSLVHLMNWTLRFVESLDDRRYRQTISHEDELQRLALQRQILAWPATLDALIKEGNLSDLDIDGTKVLRLHQVVTEIWVALALEREECRTDLFISDFEKAMALADDIQAFAGFPEQRDKFGAPFLFDMEIVSPLYFVCLKCRHPVLRRRALAMLRYTVRREGLWDTNVAYALAKRVMEVEERSLLMLDGSEVPPEHDRVHLLQVRTNYMIFPRQHKATFHTKPDGVDGAWHIWEEDIVIQERIPPRHARISRTELFAKEYHPQELKIADLEEQGCNLNGDIDQRVLPWLV